MSLDNFESLVVSTLILSLCIALINSQCTCVGRYTIAVLCAQCACVYSVAMNLLHSLFTQVC